MEFLSDFNVCSLTSFNDVLFHLKIAIEDEADFADDSSKLNHGIVQRDYLWVLQGSIEFVFFHPSPSIFDTIVK